MSDKKDHDTLKAILQALKTLEQKKKLILVDTSGGCKKFKCSRTTWWKMRKNPKFPKGRKITDGKELWQDGQLDEFYLNLPES